jgi:histidinol-phosphate aminotransferase
VYCQLFGIDFIQIPLADDFSIDVSAYQQPCGGVILANPNAPTSVLLSLERIKQLLEMHPHRVVVIDEAYIDFGGQSAVSLIDQYPNLVVCQTTSKSRALAGLRIGMAFAQAHLIEALERVKNSFNSYPIDRVAIAGGIASFEDQAYFEQTCQQLIANREALVQQMQALGFEVLPSAANFIFARHPQHRGATARAGLARGRHHRPPLQQAPHQ